MRRETGRQSIEKSSRATARIEAPRHVSYMPYGGGEAVHRASLLRRRALRPPAIPEIERPPSYTGLDVIAPRLLPLLYSSLRRAELHITRGCCFPAEHRVGVCGARERCCEWRAWQRGTAAAAGIPLLWNGLLSLRLSGPKRAATRCSSSLSVSQGES